MNIACSKFSTRISGMIDNEITASEKTDLSAHLKQCPACASRYEQEKKLKSVFRKTYRNEVAPVHLRTRIRRALSEIAPAPGFWELLAQLFSRHTLKSALSTAVLVLLITLPYSTTMTPPDETAGPSGINLMSIAGTITCADCEIMHAAGHDKECADYHHLGIKDENGKLWRFTNAVTGKDLIQNPGDMGKKFQVEGQALLGKDYNHISVNQLSKI